MLVLSYIATVVAIINIWIIAALLGAITRDWHPIQKLVRKIRRRY